MSSIAGLTEIEDIRLFLEERVESFDETIDTTVGSNFDTAVIQPLITRLGPDPYNTPIREFNLERLTREFPGLVVQDGEPIDDLVVKPMQVLLEPFRRQIKQVSTNQSLANPETLNEREADNLGANWFTRRVLGGFSIGVARLFYSAPQFALVTPSNPVFTSAGLRFFPVENQAINADRMLFNVENNLFFLDIVVRAESQGAAFNIDPDSLTGIEGVPAVVKVQNKQQFEEGIDKEDTIAFVERIENSLTEKSLVVVRGINARLTDVFEQVRLIQVIGMGDVEMNRDIITGISQTSPFASFTTASLGPGNEDVISQSDFTDGVAGHNDFLTGDVQVGDIVTITDFANDLIVNVTVVAILATNLLRITPQIVPFPGSFPATIRRAGGSITISDIPGGILQPTTPAGTIEIEDDQVHIGGALDVFVRSGEPQEREITLEGILDGNPLHFGLDLESFGDEVDHRVHIIERTVNQGCIVDTDRFGVTLVTNDELLIRRVDDGVGLGDGGPKIPIIPWDLTDEDVSRYVQFLGGNPSGPDFGTFEIIEIIGEENHVDTTPATQQAVRVKLDISIDLETGLAPSAFGDSIDFDLDIRILESVSTKNRVRDRDASVVVLDVAEPAFGSPHPQILGGIDYVGLGVEIGDSVVIETGEDAGIYSIRRILDWLGSNDTLILDRDLTTTTTPSGTGDSTGLRYRIDDELDVDLISPKVTKIPLGSLFDGQDLDTVAGSAVVSVSASTNFLLAGVEAGDTLEVLEGDNAGTFAILSVTGTTATVDAPMSNTGFSQSFTVYRGFTGVSRPMVRIETVGLLDSNNQPTGQVIPYGDNIDARTLGILSNRAQGNVVERFTGETKDNGVGRVDFFDTNVDFVVEGVEINQRLNIIGGVNDGSYTIIAVGLGDGLVDNSTIRVAAVVDGGVAFESLNTSVHYSIGLPSSGFARLFFQDPTTVEIQTGLSGGRLQTDEPTPKEFRFSEVTGFATIPAGGTGTIPDARDIRVAGTVLESIPLTGDLTDGITVAGLSTFGDSDSTFITDDVEPGFFLRITAGAEVGDYKILTVDSEIQLTVDFTFSNNSSAETYEIVKYESIIELTDPARPGVFELEIQEGDALEVHEQAQFHGIFALSADATWSGPSTSITIAAADTNHVKVGNYIRLDSDGQWFRVLDSVGVVVTIDAGGLTIPSATGPTSVVSSFDQKGIFGKPAGLRTIAASNQVSVPVNSVIDFVVMNLISPLPGQRLFIDSGPDIGEYTIEEVLDSKTLRIDALMTATTGTILAADTDTPRDGTLEDDGDSTKVVEPAASSDASSLLFGAQVGHFITLFETLREDISGTFEISDLLTGEVNKLQIDTAGDFVSEASVFEDKFSIGQHAWVRTENDTLVEQEFRIYSAIATEVAITQVATKRDDVVTGVRRGNITASTTLLDVDTGFSMSALRGDLLEVLSGPAAGVYTLSVNSVTFTATIQANPAFPVTISDVPYRIWGGMHGSRRMFSVGPKNSSSGRVKLGDRMPYRIVRPKVFRVSSTEMQDNFDDTLFFVDIQIESQGAGDDLNLEEGLRFVVVDHPVLGVGLRADGYKYSVENNNLTFSMFEEVSITFDRRFLPLGNSDSPENLTEVNGRNLSITYESSTTVRLVNDLMRSDRERPINASPIARHFLPSFLLTTLSYAGGASVDEVGPDLEDFINNQGAEAEIAISDLEAILTRRGATFVRHPIELVTVTHDIDRNLVVDRSDNVIGGLNATPFNGTGRISAFFTKLNETLILLRES